MADRTAVAGATTTGDDAEFIRGYVAGLRELSKPRSMDRAGIICADLDAAARAHLRDPDWTEPLLRALDDAEPAAEPAPRPPAREGIVYALADDERGLVKIGWTSSDVEGRRRAIEKASGCALRLLGTLRGTIYDERAAHEALAESRARGEWFVQSRPVREWIEALS